MDEDRSLLAIRRLFNDENRLENRPDKRAYEADIPKLFGEDPYLPEVTVRVSEDAPNGNVKTYRLTVAEQASVIDYTTNVVETFSGIYQTRLSK